MLSENYSDHLKKLLPPSHGWMQIETCCGSFSLDRSRSSCCVRALSFLRSLFHCTVPGKKTLLESKDIYQILDNYHPLSQIIDRFNFLRYIVFTQLSIFKVHVDREKQQPTSSYPHAQHLDAAKSRRHRPLDQYVSAGAPSPQYCICACSTYVPRSATMHAFSRSMDLSFQISGATWFNIIVLFQSRRRHLSPPYVCAVSVVNTISACVHALIRPCVSCVDGTCVLVVVVPHGRSLAASALHASPAGSRSPRSFHTDQRRTSSHAL
jgi:hypothetical protein